MAIDETNDVFKPVNKSFGGGSHRNSGKNRGSRRQNWSTRAFKYYVLVLCIGPGLSACKLVDQTSFGAAPAAPEPDQLTQALRAGSGIPLVIIRYDTANLTYDAALRSAIELAEGRKPGATYDVATVVPALAAPDQQVAATAQTQSDASLVMAEMVDLGVSPERIHLLARTDPGVNTREIRIFVR